jgi:AcrR family transcriptional regulator
MARVASTTRSDQTALAKQRILDVAVGMFAERGYDATAMQDLAKELGLTRAALYYHYASKADILREIIATETARFVAAMDGVAKIASRPARIDATIAALVGAGLNQRRGIAFLIAEPAVRAMPDSEEGRADFFDRVAEVIYRGAPSSEQRFAVVTAFVTFAALPSFAHLSDDEVAPILTKVLRRLLSLR